MRHGSCPEPPFGMRPTTPGRIRPDARRMFPAAPALAMTDRNIPTRKFTVQLTYYSFCLRISLVYISNPACFFMPRVFAGKFPASEQAILFAYILLRNSSSMYTKERHYFIFQYFCYVYLILATCRMPSIEQWQMITLRSPALWNIKCKIYPETTTIVISIAGSHLQPVGDFTRYLSTHVPVRNI